MTAVFQQTVDAIETIRSANSPDEICSRLTTFTGQFGLTGMIAGTMPMPNDPPKKQASHLLASGFPEDWMHRYLARSYFRTDPVIRRIQSNIQPFQWTEVEAYVDDTNFVAARQIFGEASEFGLNAGFAVPMITLDGDVAAVSLAGERIDVPPTAPGMIAMVSNFAIARAIELRTANVRRVKAKLAPREIECIRWTAEGKTQWEISVILSVSEYTVETHLKNAARKLSDLSPAISSRFR
ncbi:MAG: LuxR family transcriptional regulator [Alphaproteobacteria bacterium]|nr:LuxR family transcriptional regulator [Alphaproteobacteria bacterium]